MALTEHPSRRLAILERTGSGKGDVVDALDDALTVFAATAPKYGRLGLANHGPMAAEALDHLGRADAIEGWVARYRPRLDVAPPPAPPLGEDAWPGALGDEARYPEWLALFERELADRPAAVVVGEWAPRLLPGTVGAATHGLIRTAHALRGLGGADTPPRRLELASALAFWGSSYRELPGPPLLIGHQRVPEALAALPYLPEDAPRRLLISDMVAQVAAIADEFEQGVSSLAGGAGSTELLDQLASGGALAYLRNADGGGAIGLLHSVTSPLACELLLPWLEAERSRRGPGLRLAGGGRAARGLRARPHRSRARPERLVERGPGGQGDRLGGRARHQADRGRAALLQALRGPDAAVGGGRRVRPSLSPAL